MIVYIKGMEMPKNEPLLVKINPDGSVSTTAKNGYKKYEAVLVPPHGRCIDVDALIKELTLNDEDDNSGASLLMAIFIEVLKAAPTIIPAEEPSGDSGMLEG